MYQNVIMYFIDEKTLLKYEYYRQVDYKVERET